MSADDKAAAAWDDYINQQQEEKIEQLERELNAAISEIERLRKANLQLREGAEEQKQQIQTLKWDLDASRNNCSRKNDRIRYLIKLGLETTRPDGLERWQEEEEQ